MRTHQQLCSRIGICSFTARSATPWTHGMRAAAPSTMRVRSQRLLGRRTRRAQSSRSRASSGSTVCLSWPTSGRAESRCPSMQTFSGRSPRRSSATRPPPRATGSGHPAIGETWRNTAAPLPHPHRPHRQQRGGQRPRRPRRPPQRCRDAEHLRRLHRRRSRQHRRHHRPPVARPARGGLKPTLRRRRLRPCLLPRSLPR